MAENKYLEVEAIAIPRSFKNDWKFISRKILCAWIWMLLEAEWNDFNTCELEFNLRKAPKLWGMFKSEANLFLKRCVDEGAIEVSYYSDDIYQEKLFIKILKPGVVPLVTEK